MFTYDRWIADQVPDMQGKVAVITGANSGLGLETTRVLARRRAQVVMAVRDLTRGEQAAQAIRSAVPAANLEVVLLDLASLASIRHFAERCQAKLGRLDVLINNAGVMAIPRRVTADGFEMQFGINHLGHFALTGLLLPLIVATPAARIVTVSSSAHMLGKINFGDLHGQRSYAKWAAYAQSKLANLLFAYELQRRLAAAGRSAASLAAHPGYAATNLQAAGPQMEGSPRWVWIMAQANRVLAQHAEMGALPILHAAASPDVRGGDYIGPDGWLGQRGFPKKVRSSPASYDQATAAQLWRVSEELTGIIYNLSKDA
jgi:NAD(P)-dependent dehydrogenase (short-subunit alcohol dehydrogenase family)